MTAKEFTEQLSLLQSGAELKNVQRFFREPDPSNKFMGVRMSNIFALAKTFKEMPITEIHSLLLSEYYELRMGAVSVMDFQARDKKTSSARKKELYQLYMNRHDRINNWDLVDRAAPYVVGGYLFDKPRNVLYKLANSKNVWERRTAIVSTYYFIRQKDVSDTFKIAELLLHDQHDLIQKAVGSWIREAGKYDPLTLIEFLDEHAASMPAVMLRYAVEKLSAGEKRYYVERNKRMGAGE